MMGKILIKGSDRNWTLTLTELGHRSSLIKTPRFDCCEPNLLARPLTRTLTLTLTLDLIN